jgi:hypothetical protein
VVPWQPQPVPQQFHQPSPWPLVGMFGLGLAVGLALGGGWSSGMVREQLRQIGGGFGTTAGRLMTPIRQRASAGGNNSVRLDAAPVVPPGPGDLPASL